MTQEQINCLNKASREETGLSFMSAMSEGYDILETVHKAMKEYALACLEKAAQNAKMIEKREVISYGVYDVWKIIDKDSITNPDNLV